MLSASSRATGCHALISIAAVRLAGRTIAGRLHCRLRAGSLNQGTSWPRPPIARPLDNVRWIGRWSCDAEPAAGRLRSGPAGVYRHDKCAQHATGK
jgi:hypothetical protein